VGDETAVDDKATDPFEQAPSVGLVAASGSVEWSGSSGHALAFVGEPAQQPLSLR
jgi:hypothetical protein